MKSACVYCGSSPGVDTIYVDAARALGAQLASRGVRLVFGGVGLGLMGAVADGVLDAGGAVVGIIPAPLRALGIAHARVRDLVIVDDMHARKRAMADLADGFIVLPGGCGTMDEFFEVFTWSQLGLHAKPIGLVDTQGYYAELRAFLDAMVAKRFLKAAYRDSLIIDTDAGRLLDRMANFVPLQVSKWNHVAP